MVEFALENFHLDSFRRGHSIPWYKNKKSDGIPGLSFESSSISSRIFFNVVSGSMSTIVHDFLPHTPFPVFLHIKYSFIVKTDNKTEHCIVPTVVLGVVVFGGVF